MEKYYTPKIEEFYVGFELMAKTGASDWVNAVVDFAPIDGSLAINFYGNSIIITEGLDLTRFRVKYINREDI